MIEFVADVAGNHNGDLERCRRLISEAARVGCRAIQFPLFRIEQMFAPQVLKVSAEHRLYRRQELPLRFVLQLSTWARECDLKFGLVVCDLDTVDAVQTHVDYLALSPYELPWLDLVDRAADTGLPLTLDTGMAEAGEIWNGIQTALEAGCLDLTLLRSVARYPAPEQSCNLSSLGTVRELLVREFAPLYKDAELKAGWADNSASVGAVARAINHWGCDVVAFGFDLDGEGDSFARGGCWLPDQVGEVIAGGFLPVRRDSDGNGRLAPDPGELEERRWRADPRDGLRPPLAQRKSWATVQPEASRRGPDVYFVIDGTEPDRLRRGLALAESLRDNHDADILFLIPGQPHWSVLLERRGFNWARFESTANVVSQIVFLNNITAADGPPVCVIDTGATADQIVVDLHDEGLLTLVVGRPDCEDADLCLMPGFGWRDPHGPDNVLGGDKYLLVPDDVLTWRARRPLPLSPGVFPRVLVCFGPDVPGDRTTAVVTALSSALSHGAVQVALDPAADHSEVVAQKLESRFPDYEIISTGDPVEPLLAGADAVITGPGLMAIETLCLGVPVFVLASAEDQAAETGRLVGSGAVVDLGLQSELTADDLSTQLRQVFSDADRMSRLRFHAQELAAGPLDGHGAARVADRISHLLRERGESGSG